MKRSRLRGSCSSFLGDDLVYNSMILRVDNPLWIEYLITCDKRNREVSRETGK